MCGDFVRRKTDVAVMNQALCKVLPYDLVVVIDTLYERGLGPVFEAGARGVSEVAVARRI